jgi:dienelactone hydrolase
VVRRHLHVLVAAAIIAACSTAAEPLAFDAATVDGPGSNASAELYQPEGAGPFPAVVVLHGCDGVGRHYREWARRLAEWGYVALLVDSFRPRGVRTVCNKGMLVPPLIRAADAFAAADYLRRLPSVRGDRIAVIGFSHGGWTVLKAVLADTVAADRATPFAAAVAFYPACQRPASPLASDTLILIGEADDWTPERNCVAWRGAAETAGHALELKTYPGALHGFDAPFPPHWYAGHWVGRDPDAASDAIAETRRFLAARLDR